MPHYEYKCRRCQFLTLYLLGDRTMTDAMARCASCNSPAVLLVAWYRDATEHITSLREKIDELEENIDALESGDEPCQDFQKTKPN